MRELSGALVALISIALLPGCSGGGSGAGGGEFALIEFLESGQNNIPRNRQVRFRFSSPLAAGQDLFTRLKIQNINAVPGESNFARAAGTYIVSAEIVFFEPRLPTKPDRSDAGFKANGNYHVFLSGGPDGLMSSSGDRIPTQQEFIFETNEYFEDPDPAEPPRAFSLVARDSTTDVMTDLSRMDPRPFQLALLSNADLIAGNRYVDPGAGGEGQDYSVPWQFDLLMSEPLDPSTITTEHVELLELHGNATDSPEDEPPTASPGHVPTRAGHPFIVPIGVELIQGTAADGQSQVIIRVTPRVILVDDARYRLTFSGSVLGVDYRKTLNRDNGLTGDGLTEIPPDGEYPEPGGLGYTTEFIVRNRPTIAGMRPLVYNPLEDGINPEIGQSVFDESRHNNALYNPVQSPGKAVGFLADFGDGSDGPLAVSGGNTLVIDTGDTANTPIGNPFDINDLNAQEIYNKLTLDSELVTYDSVENFELNLESLVVSSSSTLRIVGRNPAMIRVTGIVEIRGKLDASGADGQNGGGGSVAVGGAPGAGGDAGGDSRRGYSYSYHTHSRNKWARLLQLRPQIKNAAPYSENGQGPGRGLRGAESFNYTPCNDAKNGVTGTGGGGASHAIAGELGEDRLNKAGIAGTEGPAYGFVHCNSKGGFTNESVIGMRGIPGDTYGDREIFDITRGGSGGGAGGNAHGRYRATGGGGGGGGGSLSLLVAQAILVPGGTITVAGGNGGRGFLGKPNSSQGYSTGGGGGGAGGSLVLISGTDIDLSAGGVIDARGGIGGARSDVGGSATLGGTNAGGNGGHGYIFLMDPNGKITGLTPSEPGNYDGYSHGVLTIREFEASRFGSIAAVTELFNVGASHPTYANFMPGDILGLVNDGQVIRIFASVAQGNPEAPLGSDPATERAAVEVAVIRPVNGATAVQFTGDMPALYPSGVPGRYPFLRIDARFEYDDLVEAALGPLASIDQVNARFTFN